MPGRTVSRRMVVGLLGSGVVLAPAVTQALGSVTTDTASVHPASVLLAPLQKGERVAGFLVASISPLEEGAVTAVLRDDSGRAFKLEILARDASPLAPRPPAETSRFAVYVQNGGDGWVPTVEEQGLAAMALAKIVASNEATVDAQAFLTHAERFARHRESLVKKGPKTRRGT
jgi:hypothetical protein